MNKVVNIFITDSSFQLFMASYMIQRLPECQSVDNILFNVSQFSGCDVSPDPWVKIIDQPILSFSTTNLFKLQQQIRSALKELKKQFIPYDEVHIFMGTLFKFQNVVYHTFVKNSNHIKYYNYPDGNNSLFLQRATITARLSMLCKSLVAHAARINFGFFPHFAQDRIGLLAADKLYSCLPELVHFFSGDIVDIGLPEPDFQQKTENICVFCGMPIEKGMKRNWQNKMAATAAFIAANVQDSTLIYKPHPREDILYSFPIFKKYGFKLWQECGYPDTALEHCICSGLRPKQVYSWWSSALINVKIMLKDQVECLAYRGLEFYELNPEECRHIITIYKYLGIKYIAAE